MTSDTIALAHVVWLRAAGHSLVEAWREAALALAMVGLSAPRRIDGWDDVVLAFARAHAAIARREAA